MTGTMTSLPPAERPWWRAVAVSELHQLIHADAASSGCPPCAIGL